MKYIKVYTEIEGKVVIKNHIENVCFDYYNEVIGGGQVTELIKYRYISIEEVIKHEGIEDKLKNVDKEEMLKGRFNKLTMPSSERMGCLYMLKKRRYKGAVPYDVEDLKLVIGTIDNFNEKGMEDTKEWLVLAREGEELIWLNE